MIEFGDIRLPDAFWSKIQIAESGCWLWLGSISIGGYGRCSKKFGHTYAHRAAYVTLVAPVPVELDVDHLCHVFPECQGGNTCLHRRCVNPAHLKPATERENVLRSGGRAALNAVKTHCPRGHELSGYNLMNDGGRRTCRACKYASKHRWYADHPDEYRAMDRRAKAKRNADPARRAKYLERQRAYDLERRPNKGEINA